jgi:ligand-binding sensor domain-containing protein
VWWALQALADDRLPPPPGDAGALAVMSIAQDDAGWMWFGGVEGLWRYDGARRTRWGGDFFGEPIEVVRIEGESVLVLGQDRQLYTLTASAWRPRFPRRGATAGT